jgi:D-serine dehydratase
MLSLRAIEDTRLDAGWKGVPHRPGLRLGDVSGQGWNLLKGDLPTPVAVLRQSALDHNSQWMTAFARGAGMELCPHGKTTMAPQLFDRQLREGAWGVTAATSAHIAVYLKHGVRRILHANQLVGRENIKTVLSLLAEAPGVEFYTLVDSFEGLHRLFAGLEETPIGRPLRVLLEIGAPGGRTGVRTNAEAIALARAIASASPRIALHGIECFEGVYSGRSTDDAGKADAVLDAALAAAVAIHDAGLLATSPALLSAGGSAFFDLVAQRFGASGLPEAFTPVLRSGCYLTHDSLHYRRIFEHIRERSPELASAPGLESALEVWGSVQSRPEAGLVLVNLGKRDISHDIELPVAELWLPTGSDAPPQPVPQDHRVASLADQHLFLAVPHTSPLKVGDLVSFGVAHPCTTFDKWPLLFVVDDDYRVLSAIRTFF